MGRERIVVQKEGAAWSDCGIEFAPGPAHPADRRRSRVLRDSSAFAE